MSAVPPGQAAALLSGDFQSLGMGLYTTQALLNTSVHASKVLFFPLRKPKCFMDKFRPALSVLLHTVLISGLSPHLSAVLLR